MLAPAGGIRLGVDVRPHMIGELLGPYLGILVALHNASNTSATSQGFETFMDQIYDLGITDELLQECMNMVMDENLSGLGPMRPDELSSAQACIRLLRNKAETRGAVDPPKTTTYDDETSEFSISLEHPASQFV